MAARPKNQLLEVSIPQAVGAVATAVVAFGATFGVAQLVSIPQAVGAVATYLEKAKWRTRFIYFVSIPQAVGAVATRKRRETCLWRTMFQYRKR